MSKQFLAERHPADNAKVPLDTKRIKALRRGLGLSQEDAARKAAIPGRQRWNKIESGRVRNITLDTLDRIAAALGVKAKDLLN